MRWARAGREVLATALGRALRLLAAGSAAGLALGLLASRVLSYIVYQATPRDPLVLAGVVAAMALLGLIATWLPAQRALHVDPMALLREECACLPRLSSANQTAPTASGTAPS